MDLMLDPELHDLIFDNGRSVTSDIETALSQKVRITLLTFAGEWFLDTEHGVPYFQSILGKRRSKQAVDAIFQRIIKREKLVQEITYFSSLATPERGYFLTFSVKAVTGVITPMIKINIDGT